MRKDNQNLEVSTDNGKAIDEINFFIRELISSGKNADAIINAAAIFPEVLLIQCYAAAFNLYAQTTVNSLNAAKYLNVAEKGLAQSTQREKLFYFIILAWQQVNYELALTLLTAYRKSYPQDLAAIKISEWLFYVTGQAYHAKQFLAMCEDVKEHHQKNSHFLAIYAFALELSGQFNKSHETALQALTIEPLTPWAHHALGHIYMMQGQLDNGIHTLEMYRPSWNDITPPLKRHNTWHLALMYMAELKFESAKKLFPNDIWGPVPDNVLQQMDVISFLWRMDMAEEPQTDEWKKMAEFMGNHPYEYYMPYNNTHYVYALIKSGHKEGAYQVIEDVAGYAKELGTHEYRKWHNISLPLMRGCLAFAEGDYQKASSLLKPIISESFCVGGSDAQVELFLQTYFLSLLNSGQTKEAKIFFDKYLSHYTSTPLGVMWLEKLNN